MPLPEAQDLHPEMIADLKAMIGVVIGVVITLVGTLYSLLRSTDSRQQDQIEGGLDRANANAIDIEKLKKDMESIREWVVDIEKDVDTGQIRQLQDHETLHLIEKVIEAIKIHHMHQHGEEIK